MMPQPAKTCKTALPQSGYLDRALASPGPRERVTGAAFWHIDADEPAGLDYNDCNQPLLYHPDEFRSSDHDPVLVGLALCDATAQSLDVSVSPERLWPPAGHGHRGRQR